MKKICCIVFSFLSFFFIAKGQNMSIIDNLNMEKTSQGTIVIYQDNAIKNLVGNPQISTALNDRNATNIMKQLNTEAETTDSKASKTKHFTNEKGFRIQVYSGSNQKRSKSEAESRKNAIKGTFSHMDVSVSYVSPVWRVKAGNFKTKEQAEQALSELKTKFPNFGREMYIIRDIVKIPVD